MIRLSLTLCFIFGFFNTALQSQSVKDAQVSFTLDTATNLYHIYIKNKKNNDHAFFEVRPFKDGKAWVKDTSGSHIYYKNQEDLKIFLNPADFGRWGLINTRGKYIIPPTYHYLDTVINGYIRAGIRQHQYQWVIRNLTKPEEDNIIIPEKPNMAPIEGARRMYSLQSPMYYGLLNEKGGLVIPVKYPWVNPPLRNIVLLDRGADEDNRRPLILIKNHPENKQSENRRFVLLYLDDGRINALPYDNVFPLTFEHDGFIKTMDDLQFRGGSFPSLPEIYIAQKSNGFEHRYGLLNAYGKEMTEIIYFKKESEMVTYMPDPNNWELMVDTLIVSYTFPFFQYLPKTSQIHFAMQNDTCFRPIITDLQGNILFNADDEFTCLEINHTGRMTFARNQDFGTPKFQEWKMPQHASVDIKQRYTWGQITVEPPYHFDSLIERVKAFRKYPGASISPAYSRDFTLLTNYEKNIHLVEFEGYYGLCDSMGKEILPIQYCHIDSLMDDAEFLKPNPQYRHSAPTFFPGNPEKGEYIVFAMNREENHRYEWIIVDGNMNVKKVYTNLVTIDFDTERNQYRVVEAPGKIRYEP